MNPPFHHVAAVSARLFDQNNLRRYCQRHSQIEGEPDNGEASSYALVIRPDDQLDYGTRRVAQIRAVLLTAHMEPFRDQLMGPVMIS